MKKLLDHKGAYCPIDDYKFNEFQGFVSFYKNIFFINFNMVQSVKNTMFFRILLSFISFEVPITALKDGIFIIKRIFLYALKLRVLTHLI